MLAEPRPHGARLLNVYGVMPDGSRGSFAADWLIVTGTG
jgi:hypothetical protein